MTTKTVDGTQKIKAAVIDNYKGIKHIEFSATEKHIFSIGGKNGNGKTSLIDALKTAIGGKKLALNPVRVGEKRASIEVEMNDFTIKLHIDTDGKIEPVVTHLETGKTIKSPKKALKDMFGDFAMDPAEFNRMKASDQIAALKAITVDDEGKPITFDDLDKKYDTLYEQRKLDKHELKACQTRLASNPKVEGAPEAEGCSETLLNELDLANIHNLDLQRLDNTFESKVRESTAAEKERDRLLKALATAETALKDADRAVEAAKTARDKGGKKADTTETENKLKNLEESNQEWRGQQAHNKARRECVEQAKVVSKVEQDIEDLKDERKERLASSKFPVEGLEFDDNGITLNGIPFGDASESEKLRVSFKISLAGRPQMPVVFIDNGELFDDDMLKVIEQEAKKLDAQVFMCLGSRREVYDLFVEAGEQK